MQKSINTISAHTKEEQNKLGGYKCHALTVSKVENKDKDIVNISSISKLFSEILAKILQFIAMFRLHTEINGFLRPFRSKFINFASTAGGMGREKYANQINLSH